MNELTKIIPAPKLSDPVLKDMFDYRLRRLRKSMNEKNVSLSILVSHVSLRYAIDFDEFQIFQSHIPTCYLFVPAEGGLVGVKLEQMVLVTDTGIEILSHYPFEDKLIH